MALSAQARSRLILASTFLVALVVSLIKWPEWAQPFRPDWVGLVLIYWCLAIPHRVGLGTAWGLGLLEDILYGSLLGQHALARTVIAFIAIRLHLKIRMFPRMQQAASVFLMLLIGQFIITWIKGFINQGDYTYPYLTPSIVGMVLWPWLFVIMRDIRRRGHID